MIVNDKKSSYKFVFQLERISSLPHCICLVSQNVFKMTSDNTKLETLRHWLPCSFHFFRYFLCKSCSILSFISELSVQDGQITARVKVNDEISRRLTFRSEKIVSNIPCEDKQVQAGVEEETVLQCDWTPCIYMYTYLIVLLVNIHPSNKLIWII